MLSLVALTLLQPALAGDWPSVPGHAEVLGVAPDGSAWAVRLVLPAAELSESSAACGYPAIKGAEPAAASLALCDRVGFCRQWLVYELHPCTPHDAAKAQLDAAKAAWTAAGVPWDQPVLPLEKKGDAWLLPADALSAWGIWGPLRIQEKQHSMDDGSTEQRLEFITQEEASAEVVVTTYPPMTGAMGWVFLDHAFLLPQAGVVFGFLSGGCCGSEFLATDPVTIRLDQVARRLKGGE